MSKYTSYFCNDGHQVITDLRSVGRNYFTMGLFLDGKFIGTGSLTRPRLKKVSCRKFLQTESTGINKKFRKKGHGIYLYSHLIETARRLGATRIYSSGNLNKYSIRMWAEKLPKIYPVKASRRRAKVKCGKCGHKELIVDRYYIDLR